MRIIAEPSYKILTPISEDGIEELQLIELAARTCYKSEDKITEDGESAKKMVKMLIEKGHEAMLEHSFLSVRFLCDYGVSHELVNYPQNSFGNELIFVKPNWVNEFNYDSWAEFIKNIERGYFILLTAGYTYQEARTILPNCLANEIVVSTNYREWRHILALRTAPSAHPDMRRTMIPLLKYLQVRIPIIFDDIKVEV